MTQKQIDDLPPLLRRADVIRLANIAPRKYYDFLECSKVECVRIPGISDQRVLKTALLKVLHLSSAR